jgi:hypothetical protein
MGPRASLDPMENREASCSSWESNSCRPACYFLPYWLVLSGCLFINSLVPEMWRFEVLMAGAVNITAIWVSGDSCTLVDFLTEYKSHIPDGNKLDSWKTVLKIWEGFVVIHSSLTNQRRMYVLICFAVGCWDCLEGGWNVDVIKSYYVVFVFKLKLRIDQRSRSVLSSAWRTLFWSPVDSWGLQTSINPFIKRNWRPKYRTNPTFPLPRFSGLLTVNCPCYPSRRNIHVYPMNRNLSSYFSLCYATCF